MSIPKDPDARWLKKGHRYHFGYKAFVATDSVDGFIRHVHVTSANVSEVHQLPETLENIETQRVFADKGYACKDNDEFLKQSRIKNAIMSKASRNHPLSSWQKLRNKLISHYRFIVEQGFGTLKKTSALKA